MVWYENCAVLVQYGQYTGNWFGMRTALFWCSTNSTLVIPWRSFGTINRLHLQGKNFWALKIWPISSPETSVMNYHYTLCNIPEERNSYELRSGSLKSHSSNITNIFIHPVGTNQCLLFKCHTLKHLKSLKHVSNVRWLSSGSFWSWLKSLVKIWVFNCGYAAAYFLHVLLCGEACRHVCVCVGQLMGVRACACVGECV
jgi:hypothetical protein